MMDDGCTSFCVVTLERLRLEFSRIYQGFKPDFVLCFIGKTTREGWVRKETCTSFCAENEAWWNTFSMAKDMCGI